MPTIGLSFLENPLNDQSLAAAKVAASVGPDGTGHFFFATPSFARVLCLRADIFAIRLIGGALEALGLVTSFKFIDDMDGV